MPAVFSLWWLAGGADWPLVFITRIDYQDFREIVDTFVYEIDPHGRGIILL